MSTDALREQAAETKACCAAAYQSDVVAMVLGPSYHPGGLTLTRRLADLTGVRDARALDVASGPGATAMLLAQEFGAEVDGVDLGERQVADANAKAAETGANVRFTVGDAERIPFEDGLFDAAVCECAFCTFPDKQTAAAELARVLRPGGRLGLTDVTVRPGGLDGELSGLAGWVACLADARPLEEYAEILTGAGLRIVHTERHDDALARMIDQIDARLAAFSLVAGSNPALAEVDFPRARELTAQAASAVRQGIAGYALLVAEKPR